MKQHPLRRATLTGKEPSLAIASCLEHCLNKAKHSGICYSLGYEREKLFVMDGTEKVSEVRIYDPLRSALNLLPNLV